MSILLALSLATLSADEPLVTTLDFTEDPGIVAETAGPGSLRGNGQKRDGVGAKVADGELVVIDPWWKLDTNVGLGAPTGEGARRMEARFTLTVSPGLEGLGFAWLDVAEHGTEGPAGLPAPSPECRVEVPAPEETPGVAPLFYGGWEAPNFAGSLGIGFDARNPWTSEPFRGSGNIHHRPEHEISIHWDGVERFKKTTETDFRDEEPREVHLVVEYVPGGAFIDLKLGEEQVFERYFLAGAEPYAGRAAFGGRNAETAGWATVDDLELTLADRFDPSAGPGFPAPDRFVAIDRQLNDKDAGSTTGTVTLPEDLTGYDRVLLTLRLDEPEAGFDPWDRLAHVYVTDERLGEVEVLRYITPYDKGGVWTLDATDLKPVLTGERTFTQRCGTYGEGWVVSVELACYPRPEGAAPRPEPYRLERLWEGKCIVGDPARPPAAFFQPQRVAIDEHTVAARVNTVVTGHGMSPNSGNAAEFMPLGRTVTVDGVAHANELWKTDNYLNPCRPQGGTWKYDRAGWAPGDIVPPWSVDCTPLGEELLVTYALAPYVNTNRGQTWDPFHQVTSYAVLYRDLTAEGSTEDEASAPDAE